MPVERLHAIYAIYSILYTVYYSVYIQFILYVTSSFRSLRLDFGALWLTRRDFKSFCQARKGWFKHSL